MKKTKAQDGQLRKRSYLQTPVGELELIEDGAGLCELNFSHSERQEGIPEEETPLLKEAKRQLQEYFAGERKRFDLPLSISGTPFQMKDWQALREIPYGETRSYGDIARAIGCPRGFRAVGMANRCNPVAIIIPCHRVIGTDGKLTGYAGKNKALDIKAYLLRLEGAL